MYEYGNCFFMAQIFAAELVFMYSYPKRSKFFARLIPGMAALIALSGFYPSFDLLYIGDQIYRLFKYIILFSVSAAYMAFCFKVKAVALISACTSGYALQHLSYRLMSIVAMIPVLGGMDMGLRSHIFELIVFPVTYALAWVFFGRMAAKYEFYNNTDIRLVFVSVFTLIVCLVINRFTRLWGDDGVNVGNALYGIACCLLILFINYNLHAFNIYRTKSKMMERISYEERRQFEASRQTREQLNVKFHDLKHIVSLLSTGGGNNAEVLSQYKKIIEEYDGEVRTGNETLDIIVNEKAYICRNKGITLTFMGDGKQLSFVNQFDLYSLFGNILDNAIEAADGVGGQSKKLISVTVEERSGFIAISEKNYFSGKLNIADGELRTTKADEKGLHGYGVRSIKLITQKYGGNVRVSAKDDIFTITVFLPRPGEADGQGGP